MSAATKDIWDSYQELILPWDRCDSRIGTHGLRTWPVIDWYTEMDVWSRVSLYLSGYKNTLSNLSLTKEGHI